MLNLISKKAAAFGFVAMMSAAASADERHALVGTWKLVSWQVIGEDGKPKDIFGTTPSGYLVLTPEGRSIVLTTATGRKPGTDDAPAPHFRSRCCPTVAIIVSRVTTSSQLSRSRGTKSGMAQSSGVTTELKTIGSSSSLHLRQAWYFQARQTSGGSFGFARSSRTARGARNVGERSNRLAVSDRPLRVIRDRTGRSWLQLMPASLRKRPNCCTAVK